MKRVAITISGAVLLVLCSSHAAEPKPDPAKNSLSLVAALEGEPLATVFVSDVRTLPERFAKTELGQMLGHPDYASGADALKEMIASVVGADVGKLWPDLSKLVAGPAVLAVYPSRPENKDEPYEFRLLLLCRSADQAAELTAHWPKLEGGGAFQLLSLLRMRAVVSADLPAEEKQPAWFKEHSWPAGDFCVTVLPRKLGKAIQPWIEAHPQIDPDAILPAIADLTHAEIERLFVQINIEGANFRELFHAELADGAESSFVRLVMALREKPAPWDSLMAALPAEPDACILIQSDLKPLAGDLPFLAQALERELRGKKWAKTLGRAPEALDDKRFNFVTDRLSGDIGITAKPSITGDARITVAAATKDEPATLRADIVEGLDKAGAKFETLVSARKIGDSPPLGAAFKGRGLFTAPVIGMSPGWIWVCANSAVYQDLTTAFKTGKTLAFDARKEKAQQHNDWREGDAFRARIDLERVVKLLYAAWLLSGDDGPFIAGWKVPAALLPKPQVFFGHLGTLRAGMIRNGRTLEAYSICALPGASVGLVTTLEETAVSIQNARHFKKTSEDLGMAKPPEK